MYVGPLFDKAILNELICKFDIAKNNICLLCIWYTYLERLFVHIITAIFNFSFHFHLSNILQVDERTLPIDVVL